MAQLFVFTRLVEGAMNERLYQTATVYASSQREAKQILADEFDRLRTKGRDDPPLRDLPEFDISSVELDTPKLVTLSHTQ